MNNNVLVIGSNGQLGSEVKELSINCSKEKFFYTSKKELDVTKIEEVENYILENNIKSIINCSAYTAVDKAEENINLANKINNLGVESLALIVIKHDLRLIHVSTDYVFNGESYIPYKETDVTCPVSVYGSTKLAGENAILKHARNNTIIIRTSWVYSSYGNNFFKTIKRLASEKEELGVICDQIGTPTYAKDLAEVMLKVLFDFENIEKGIYNFSNEGVASWYDFAKEIVTLSDEKCSIKPIETKDYKTLAKRPNYSVLNKSKIKKALNIDIPYWKDSLVLAIEKFKNNV